MRRQRLKNKKPNIIIRIFFNPKFFTLCLLVLIIAISIPISKNISKKYQVDQEIKELKTEIAQMEASNKNLEEIIEYLESEQFAEEQARLNLGFKEPGEEVVVIDSEEKNVKNKNIAPVSNNKNNNKSNLAKWWQYFFQNKKEL